MTWGRWYGAKGYTMSALWLSPLVAFVSGQATDPCIFKLLVSPFGRERSPVLAKLRWLPSHGAMHVEQRTISVETTAWKRFEMIQLSASGFGFGTAERGSLPEGVFKSAHRIDPP